MDWVSLDCGVQSRSAIGGNPEALAGKVACDSDGSRWLRAGGFHVKRDDKGQESLACEVCEVRTDGAFARCENTCEAAFFPEEHVGETGVADSTAFLEG